MRCMISQEPFCLSVGFYPRSLMLILVASVILSVSRASFADELRATADDHAVVAACLKLVHANAEKEAQGPLDDEEPSAAGRLAAAGKQAATQTESCIGSVTIPCQQQPGGLSTAGMVDCNTREWAVWDERLNGAYGAVLKDAPAEMATALREAQRAWLQWREKSCALPALENEGGTIVGPLYTGCMLDATARQALSLETRE